MYRQNHADSMLSTWLHYLIYKPSNVTNSWYLNWQYQVGVIHTPYDNPFIFRCNLFCLFIFVWACLFLFFNFLAILPSLQTVIYKLYALELVVCILTYTVFLIWHRIYQISLKVRLPKSNPKYIKCYLGKTEFPSN